MRQRLAVVTRRRGVRAGRLGGRRDGAADGTGREVVGVTIGMIGQREALRLFGCEVFDPDGQRIGIVGRLFLEEGTEQPLWVTIQTGLFGTNESLVPLEGAAFDGDTLTVAVLKETVRQSPPVPSGQGDLLPSQEKALYVHYGARCGLPPESVDPPAESPEKPSEKTPALAQEYVDAVRLRLRRRVATA